MKRLLGLVLLLFFFTSFSQKNKVDFAAIDWRVSSINESNIDTLAWKLTSPYKTDLEKVRAIFSWITQHISYNTGIYNAGKKFIHTKFFDDTLDNMSVWRSGDEMTAMRVLYRRVAVCDGYAKLFKTLCDYSGVQSEVITGYAKCYMESTNKFRTNHTWNAVMIDSTWYLLDVTWASGYINYANEFVQHLDESCFLTSPEQFILDHYPEDLRWTLLLSPPTLSEFRRAPFRYKSFVKYNITSYSPTNGIINAAIGDTVKIELQVHDHQKNKTISADPFFDSTTLISSPSSVFLQPSLQGNKIVYSYVVQSNDVQWLHIVYNDDVILRYRLTVKTTLPISSTPVLGMVNKKR